MRQFRTPGSSRGAPGDRRPYLNGQKTMMKNDWRWLMQYLLDRLPADIAYDDLAQLCLGLHCYVDGVPSDLQPLLNKEDQAEAFADFVRNRFDEDYGTGESAKYGANHHRPTDKGHWIEVIASMYKTGGAFDAEREREIRRKLTANKASHRTLASSRP